MGTFMNLSSFSVVRVTRRQIRCGLKKPRMEKSVRSKKRSNWLKYLVLKAAMNGVYNKLKACIWTEVRKQINS